MEITVTGKHLDIGSAFRTYIKESLEDVMKKYFFSPIEASVVVSHEADHFVRSDISVHVGRGISVRGHSTADMPHPSYDQALQKLETQLRRYKNRLRSHHGSKHAENSLNSANQYIITDTPDYEAQDEVGQPVTIAEMTTPLLTLTVSEAVMHLDLSDSPVFVFYNKSNHNLNVVYRRKDGNIGWVDPQVTKDQNSSKKSTRE